MRHTVFDGGNSSNGLVSRYSPARIVGNMYTYLSWLVQGVVTEGVGEVDREAIWAADTQSTVTEQDTLSEALDVSKCTPDS